MANALLVMLKKTFSVFFKASPYSLYILLLLLLTYMLNQLHRYALSITSVEIAQSLHYGNKACMKNANVSSEIGQACKNLNETACDNFVLNDTSTHICKYDYNGQGLAYQIVAGPVFILVFTFTGIVLSIFADKFQNRRVLILVCCLVWWSLMTLLTGFVNEYWQLAILRFGLGFGQAGCNPMASSLIADYFSLELKGSALGVYNWGIYTGYSLSFAIGNQILKYLEWRWVFIICAIPGFFVALIMFFTVRQPKVSAAVKQEVDGEEEDKIAESTSSATTSKSINHQTSSNDNATKLWQAIREFLKPSLLLLCLAGSIRNGAGYVWAYNNNSYYKFLNQTPDQISSYLGVIPIVFGIIGSFVGGFVSDQVATNAAPWNRIWVLVISQLVAAPFVFCVLYFGPPYSYYFLIPTYIFGEMWVSVCLTVLIELVPTHLRTTGIGFYFFIISNIGGNTQILVPPIQAALERAYNLTNIEAFRGVLYIFYPGQYVLSTLFFLLTLFVLKRDIESLKANATETSFAPTLAQTSGSILNSSLEDDSYDNDKTKLVKIK